MEKEFRLGRFLLLSFFLTLLLIGVLQIAVQALLGEPVRQLAEDVLHLEGAISGTGLDVIKTLFFWTVMLAFALWGATGLAESVTGSLALAGADPGTGGALDIMEDLFRTMTESEIRAYVLLSAAVLLLAVLVWLLPFIIGGTLFTIVTSRKVRQVEAARIKREEDYEKQRNLLISAVAHDIKTPMTTIAGFSKALADGDVPEEKKKDYLDEIYGKTMHTSGLVTTLFEYVKLDSAGFSMKMEETDVCELVRECTAALYVEFEERHIEVMPDIPETAIMSDIDRVQTGRAVNNILVNAYKHNPPGTKVTIQVAEERDEAKIRISDDGEMISRETACHIFDPFIQGDESRTSGSGSGLGLSVTKKIIEMQGGKIILYQYMNPEKYGKVKTFEITLKKIKPEA